MLVPQNTGPGEAHDAPYTHRFYLDADALGEPGVLVHDEGLVHASRDYVRRGIAHQDLSGFKPEKGRLRPATTPSACYRRDLLYGRGR